MGRIDAAEELVARVRAIFIDKRRESDGRVVGYEWRADDNLIGDVFDALIAYERARDRALARRRRPAVQD